MADHDGIDLESEVGRILALKLEDIRIHGIKKLPEEQYKKAQAGFQIDIRLTITQSVSEFKQRFENFCRIKTKVLPIYVAMQVTILRNSGIMIL